MPGRAGTIAVLFGFAACGPSKPPPLYASAAAPERVSAAAEDDCVDVATCQRACSGGQADGCARLGDRVAATDWHRAVSLWMQACDGGSAGGCRHAMAVAPHGEADRNAARACGLGVAGACNIVASAQLFRALAEEDAARDRLGRDAIALYQHACTLDDWSGCLSAAAAGQVLEISAGEQLDALAQRGLRLAEEACTSGDQSPIACAAAGEEHLRAGHRQDAASYLAAGCAALLADALPDDADDLLQDPLCVEASKMGATLPRRGPPPPGRPRQAGPRKVEAQRISRLVVRRPDRGEIDAMWKRRKRQVVTSFRLCVSPEGLVDRIEITSISGLIRWDLGIFDDTRRRRYRPFTVDGVPARTCTRVAYVFTLR